MISVKGKYADAAVMAEDSAENMTVEPYAFSQIQMICDNEASSGSKICVMPDVHPGKIGPIGLTMTVGDRILPGLVGVDIGCGVLAVELKKVRKEFQKLDRVIRENVPSGSQVRKRPHNQTENLDLQELICYRHIREDAAKKSLGTLGGGNHFIEVDESEDGASFLVIHSGSRHLGVEVYEHYMRLGRQELENNGIQDIPYEMTWLEGTLKQDYLHDIAIVQRYAGRNREIMAREILSGMKWSETERISCIHNYVDFSMPVPMLRKGAISAKKDEPVIIPINMRDGVLIGRGLGNTDWNQSAPHGSGRILSREAVKKAHTVSEYRKSMDGIYTTCIGTDTLDEAPFAYRGMEYMEKAIQETVEIEKILHPVYSFKAGGKG